MRRPISSAGGRSRADRAALRAYLPVRFLMRFLESLKPFAIYCLAAGAAVLIVLAVN